MVAQVGYSVAGRSRGRVTPCAIYTMHVKTRSAGFLVEPQNQGRRFVSGLTSKSLGRFFSFWHQNRWRLFSLVWPQNRWLGFPGLGIKITVMVSWFEPQPSMFRFIDCATKPTEEGRRETRIEIWW
jgi:hypothetical protein